MTMQEFKSFDPIFEQSAQFAVLKIHLAGEPEAFQTTVAAANGGELMASIARGMLAEDEAVGEKEMMILNHIAETLSDPDAWTHNAMTNAPLGCFVAYSDDEIDIEVRVYTLTDGSTTPEVTENVIDRPDVDIGDSLMSTIAMLIKAGIENKGVAFMGFADAATILDVQAFIAKNSENYSFLQLGKRRENAAEFNYRADNDQTVIAVEMSFASDAFSEFGQEIMQSDTFVAAHDQAGVTYLQFYGGKSDIFSAIQPGAHALLGIRPVKPEFQGA